MHGAVRFSPRRWNLRNGAAGTFARGGAFVAAGARCLLCLAASLRTPSPEAFV